MEKPTDPGGTLTISVREIAGRLGVPPTQALERLDNGITYINAPTIADEPHVPFGGIGDSGFGREGTDIDIDTFTEWKWITVQLPVS